MPSRAGRRRSLTEYQQKTSRRWHTPTRSYYSICIIIVPMKEDFIGDRKCKGKDNQTILSTYTALYMLDTAAKLLEMLTSRLEKFIEDVGSLSNRQHCFRRVHPTISAMSEVVKTFHSAQRVSHYSRPLLPVVTVDVRNAFNSLQCDTIR